MPRISPPAGRSTTVVLQRRQQVGSNGSESDAVGYIGHMQAAALRWMIIDQERVVLCPLLPAAAASYLISIYLMTTGASYCLQCNFWAVDLNALGPVGPSNKEKRPRIGHARHRQPARTRRSPEPRRARLPLTGRGHSSAAGVTRRLVRADAAAEGAEEPAVRRDGVSWEAAARAPAGARSALCHGDAWARLPFLPTTAGNGDRRHALERRGCPAAPADPTS